MDLDESTEHVAEPNSITEIPGQLAVNQRALAPNAALFAEYAIQAHCCERPF
jgi:hypothetical protein